MAQAVTNTVKSTNPQAGLLGLTPRPKSSPTPASPFISAAKSVGNFLANPMGHTTTGQQQTAQAGLQPLQAGTLSLTPKAPAVANTANVSPATPQNAAVATSSAPVSVAPPTPSPIVPQQTAKGLFPSVLSSIQGYAPKYDALATKAQEITDKAGEQYAARGVRANHEALGYGSTGTSPVAEGNARLATNSGALDQSAIAAGANIALGGIDKQVAALGKGQDALSSVAGLAAPQITSFGQTSFDPATGTFANGGSLPPEVMQQYAQMAATGQYSAIPSFITSNPVLNAQLNVAAKAIDPKYTPVGAQGASSILGGVPALQSANTAAEGIKNTIVSFLNQNPQLNPSALAASNFAQQWIQGKQLTDPKYQVLANYLNEYTNTLAPILGVGGDPTNLKTQIAASFINAAASGQSISQVLDAMSALATNKIVDIQSGATGGSTSVPTPTTGSGGLFDW